MTLILDLLIWRFLLHPAVQAVVSDAGPVQLSLFSLVDCFLFLFVVELAARLLLSLITIE